MFSVLTKFIEGKRFHLKSTGKINFSKETAGRQENQITRRGSIKHSCNAAQNKPLPRGKGSFLYEWEFGFSKVRARHVGLEDISDAFCFLL